ncbi:MAG: DASS family sodium-coupled anion symporter [Rectinemataceae bacterium]|nr:DASS family sodium-coupled anion symporter [Rectinemataceae bacterium]
MKRLSGRKSWAILGSLALLALVYLLPIPASAATIRGVTLDIQGRISLAVLAFALVLWIAEALPFHITGLAAILILALLGGGSYADIIRSGFGDDVIIFFIGVLVLAACLARSGLAKRFSLFVLSLTGNSTRAIIFGFLAAGAFLAMWITALASSAMLMPLALGILQDEGEEPGQSRFGKALMIAVAWGALLGALGTPAGSGSNPIALRFLSEIAHYNIGFLDWMALGIPTLLLLLPLAWLVIILFFPPEKPRLSRGREEIRREFSSQKPLSRQEIATGIIFALTILVWLVSPSLGKILGIKIPISMGALLAIVLLFLPGSAGFAWKDIQKDIDWAGILLIATGICLGMSLYNSGAASWVSAAILGGIGGLPAFWRLVAVVLGVFIIKVVFSSNTLTGTIIVPLVLALGTTLSIDARLLALAAGFASNLAVILVTTSPVNVIPYTTGYFTIKDMAKAGIILALAAAFAIALVFSLLGPFLGFSA